MTYLIREPQPLPEETEKSFHCFLSRNGKPFREVSVKKYARTAARAGNLPLITKFHDEERDIRGSINTAGAPPDSKES